MNESVRVITREAANEVIRVKKALGLESFSIQEREIMRRLMEARRDDKDEVIFTSPGCQAVRIKLFKVNTAGLMRDYHDYYAK